MATAAATDRQRPSGVSKRLRTCWAAIAARSSDRKSDAERGYQDRDRHSRRQARKERAGCQVGDP